MSNPSIISPSERLRGQPTNDAGPESRPAPVIADIREDVMAIAVSPPPGPTGVFAAAADAAPQAVETPAPWMILPGGVIDGGEIVILAIKPSMWRPVLDSAPWLVTAVALTIFLTALGVSIPGLSVATTAQVVLLVGFAPLGLAIMRWVPCWHVLTNRRIIDIQGVRQPEVHSCSLLDIRNTYLHISPVDRSLRLGTITFVMARDDQPPRFWRSIAKPDEVHAKIRRAIENAIDQFGMHV